MTLKDKIRDTVEQWYHDDSAESDSIFFCGEDLVSPLFLIVKQPKKSVMVISKKKLHAFLFNKWIRLNPHLNNPNKKRKQLILFIPQEQSTQLADEFNLRSSPTSEPASQHTFSVHQDLL